MLALADEHVQLPATGGVTCSLSASVRDMAAYSKLSDSIFKYMLRNSVIRILKLVKLTNYLAFSVQYASLPYMLYGVGIQVLSSHVYVLPSRYIELRTDVKELDRARSLLHKIHTRQLHRYIGESVLSDSDAAREKSKHEWEQECASGVIHHLRQLIVTDDELEMVNSVDACDLYVDIVKINYGKGAENPVDHCLFYGRDDESVATKIRATQVCAQL